MRCKNCSAEYPEGAKFCTQCAAALRRNCPKCGFVSPLESRFCSQCATPLYPQQALGRMREALVQARNLSHPFTLALVLGYAADLHWRRGEKVAARELWQEEAALCSQQGFKALFGLTVFGIGFIQVEGGRAEDGLRKMHDALATLTDSLVLDKPDGLVFLALALGKVGRLDQGLARIDDALALAKKTSKFGDLHVLYLIKGQLLLMKNPSGLRKCQAMLYDSNRDCA